MSLTRRSTLGLVAGAVFAPAVVRAQLSAEELHERGLARAVPAHQADAFTGIDRERHAIEQWSAAVGKPEVFDLNESGTRSH